MEVATDCIVLNIDNKDLEITITDPLWLGNTLALCYNNHNPRIVIGPHCILLILIVRVFLCVWSSVYCCFFACDFIWFADS